ncbi:Clampless protein 1 [Mycena sanguinolenta]|uniref:Clampless protein 1 n=1 Tax=Mycena sanguinolenta TaxID=230812 RepID=A0A8H7DBM0_9AGAR|nr:Clampless protein 1 [Mycena sanguinolenta]
MMVSSYPARPLAISAPPPKSSSHGAGGDASLFPVHAVVLAAHYVIASTLRTPPPPVPLAAHLFSASGANITMLLNHAAHVGELWQGVVALGVYNAELWNALDLAWEV